MDRPPWAEGPSQLERALRHLGIALANANIENAQMAARLEILKELSSHVVPDMWVQKDLGEGPWTVPPEQVEIVFHLVAMLQQT